MLLPAIYFSQEFKDAKSGILTTSVDSKIPFLNLHWVNGKAYYTNAETLQKEELYDVSVKSIKEIDENNEEFLKISKKNIKSNEIRDNFYHTDLPEGLYLTKEDFINRKSPKKINMVPKGLYGFTKPVVSDGELYCFFFNTNDDSKIKNAFALVYKNCLYFRMGAILSNRNKTDRAQDSDNPNAFTRVISGGNNYLYVEAPLGNVWEKAVYTNTSISSSMANHDKGIVWDLKNQEFNIFKNCEDYNDFIKDKSSVDVQKCQNNQPDIAKVRKAVDKIK